MKEEQHPPSHQSPLNVRRATDHMIHQNTNSGHVKDANEFTTAEETVEETAKKNIGGYVLFFLHSLVWFTTCNNPSSPPSFNNPFNNPTHNASPQYQSPNSNQARLMTTSAVVVFSNVQSSPSPALKHEDHPVTFFEHHQY